MLLLDDGREWFRETKATSVCEFYKSGAYICVRPAYLETVHGLWNNTTHTPEYPLQQYPE